MEDLSEIKMHRRIAYLLAAKRLRQKDLAAAMRIPQSNISCWINGTKEPNATSLLKLSNYLGVSIDFIVRGKEYVEQTQLHEKEESNAAS